MRKAIFLDRDGTLIEHQGHLGDPDRVVLIHGVACALSAFIDAGWVLVVVTNQPGVAKDLFTEDDIAKVHCRIDSLIEAEVGRKIPVKYYYCCWHPDGILPQWTGDHANRKPSDGMLLQATSDLDIDLQSSWMIGDSAQDIQAGIAAGCQTVWLSTDSNRMKPTMYAPSLAAVAPFILANEKVD